MADNSKKKEDILEWVELSDYDFKTAEAMQKSGRYLYVLFCCQQAVEKRLKALITDATDSFPPRWHDLIRLADFAKIALDAKQKLLLGKLTNYYIETRYPEEMKELGRKVTGRLSG
jgi:HEPN domain-containing protein